MLPYSPERHRGDEAIQATAAAWLAQRDDELTPEDAADFARWRKADPRHEAAVQRLEQAWTALQPLQNYRPESRVHPDRDLLAGAARARGNSFPALVAWAALAACVAFAAFWWWPRAVAPVPKPAVQEYATTSGGYQRMTLPDGSIVELNASSEVRVKYSVSERRVQLLRGEANFIVEKSKARPFWVEAGKVSVRAVGTAFNVRLGQSEVEVLVTEGRVEVSHEPLAAPVPAFPVEPPMLVAGQRLVIPLETQVTPIEVQSLSPALIRETLSWQGARLVFVETPLAEVVTQFNQRNQVQLVLGDPELASLPVGGSFKAENVEAFVRLLASDSDIVVERPSAGQIVLRKAVH